MNLTRIKRIFVGHPLTLQQAVHEQIPKWQALSTLSSDALSSVAYATDAILFVLTAFGAAAAVWSIPIAFAITGLLIILTLSYRQTIEAYPNGGGAYTVAMENLGAKAGLMAGAALLIDYVLTVSVSVAAGMENIASAFPLIGAHKEVFGLLVIVVIMLANLRGIRESATIFSIPTYFFIFSVFCLVGGGLWQAYFHPANPLEIQPLLPAIFPAVPAILILRAFASGCSALTGIEAISNGVSIFRAPAQRNAKITLIWMSSLLAALFLGITLLAHVFHIVPHGDQTLISLLGRQVFGNSGFYYALQIGTALILFIAANTSYADFPRLASLLAKDRYLPRQLASLGDRLVFSNGIVGLSFAAGVLLVIFKGETIHLIPLYAVGVFLSFTLSQAGMVVHHLKEKEKGWRRSLFINGLGALTTLVVLLDIASTKFTHGAWMVVVAIPAMVMVFFQIHKHYIAVGKELNLMTRQAPATIRKIRHTVIIPVSGIHQGVLDAVEYATAISTDVRACYVELDSKASARMSEEWKRWLPSVPFVILKSPYRSVIEPLIKYIDDVEQVAHDDLVTVVIPEFVTAKWWHQLLHNHTAIFIRAALAFRRRKVVTSVRYHLKGE